MPSTAAPPRPAPPRRLRRLAAALALVPLLGAGLTVAGCRGERPAAQRRAELARRGQGDVVIGVAFPWAAYRELDFGDGVDLAATEANAAGGVRGRRLRLVRVDDQGTVEGGRAAAQRLVADPSVVAVVGHLQSFVSVPAASVYDAGGLLMLSPTATDPALTAQGYGRVFRATVTERIVGRRMAEVAASRGVRRVGIMYVRDRYGRGLANAFEARARELGVDVAVRDSYNPDNVEAELAAGGVTTAAQAFEPTLRAWGRLGVDGLFAASEVPAAIPLLAAVRSAGLQVPVFGGEAMSVPPLLGAGAAAEGVVLASIFHPDEPRAEVTRFVGRFRATYGRMPGGAAALGYDAVRVLVDAMRRAPTTEPTETARALRAGRGWAGVTGTFAFDSLGNLIDRSVGQVTVRNGRFEVLPEPRPVASAASPPTPRQTPPRLAGAS